MKLDGLCNQVYVVAVNEARMQNHEYVTPEHFLYAAIMFEKGKEIIEKSGGSLKDIQKDLKIFFSANIPVNASENPLDSYLLVRMIETARSQAKGNGKDYVFLGAALAAIFSLPESFAAYILTQNGVNKLTLLRIISNEIKMESASHETPHANKNSEEGFLQMMTTDLTKKALNGQLDPLIGREDILRRTIQVLCRRLKNNPVHVGDPGVGKTAIAEGLAQLIASGAAPQKLKSARVFYMDISLVVAGTKYRGDFEERMIKLMNIISKKENPIVYIDEIHTVVGAGAVSGGGMDATSILKPFLAKGDIKFIGSTTFEEYKKFFEKDRALSRRFQRIDVNEPTFEESVKILKGVRERYEQFHNVRYSDEVITATCQLAEKYMNDRRMPDKAIDILDETGAYLRLSAIDDDYIIDVGTRDVERTVALMAKIPEKSVSSDENEKLRSLKKRLEEKIFGQEKAVEAVTHAIKAARSGLNDEEKPVASLLFVGPTGVGKTEIARQLAEHLGIPLLRYDMSEYQERHSVSRLIGSPPGYIGYEEGGLLTESINKTPHCALLLDEIEKAHGDIFNVLLQIMDYGVLTDNTGKKADFRNVIIIMTSNAGAKEIGKRVIGYEGRRLSETAIDSAIDRIFNPEFRNRLDDIIIFSAVDANMAGKIARKTLNKLGVRLAERGVKLKVTSAAVDYIASKGFSEQFGAREIIRVVEKDVKKRLVDEVLFGKLKNGGVATVDIKNDNIVIRSRAAAKRIAVGQLSE
ncbi:MAG: AAA family ATPase [Clostridiales bacterium]|jgi:ATP-dependent Clp protease ATP-binding subunit ClpA|nr:AAA family ATPase [Clostridiales bacterium]